MADKTAVKIAAGKLEKAVGFPPIGVGESRILDEHWDKIVIKCKGEKELLKALKVEDKR